MMIHPYLCRENRKMSGLVVLTSADPPQRLWEHYYWSCLDQWSCRLTPTSAGILPHCPSRLLELPINPYAYGDTVLEGPARHSHHDQPPCLWGYCKPANRSFWKRRSTPTPVGKTFALHQAMLPRLIYPYVRRENDVCAQTLPSNSIYPHACRDTVNHMTSARPVRY